MHMADSEMLGDVLLRFGFIGHAVILWSHPLPDLPGIWPSLSIGCLFTASDGSDV